jgi:hypothetical protein
MEEGEHPMTVVNRLDAAFLDVRKAYRLTYLYQRRALDLCEEIKKALSANLDFYYWTPSSGVFQKRFDRSPCMQDAWAFLPLYDFCVLYKPHGVHYEELKAGDWMLVVRISADSGNPDPHERDLDPRNFRKDAASSASTARLYVYYCSQALTANWYDNVFSDNQWPRDDGEGSFDAGIRTFGHKFPLSKMSNAEDVSECVKQFSERVRTALPLKLDR